MSKFHDKKSMDVKICLLAVDVRSAHNVGSLFRSCDGFGAELFLVGISPRPNGNDDNRLPHIAKKAHKDIAKTALGAEETVTWRYAETLSECIAKLKVEGYKIIAVEQDKTSSSLYELSCTQPTALVLGREVEGLNPTEIDLCDDVYEIPMSGAKESFNVSVAAGIALYQARA